ncbi:hypothetical protein BUALT_Bualt02G0240500 [Buddleja alternifolia]|uniref:Uncharacterized protein n=1 Tax=Buddleja alternifolia TaxID=168488 RepID=A0AAV6Y2X5_9LAMI|nr:hypothetical protein BUALT_Bualt02G0240500 [Buddleja alternifolia]
MRPEGNAAASSSSSPSSPSASPSRSVKRSRDPEDDVYLDNLNSQKRYLSEIMASSLNGLTVGEPMSENLMDYPTRPETIPYSRDEISLQYSPMSEDSDDSRYYENSTNTSSPQLESFPTSPVSPYRCQKPFTSHGSIVSSMASSQPRQRGSDNEGRFPSSPSDICHSADLRRAALLRSVQMRAQPLGPSQYELPFSPGIESGSNIEAEDNEIERG